MKTYQEVLNTVRVSYYDCLRALAQVQVASEAVKLAKVRISDKQGKSLRRVPIPCPKSKTPQRQNLWGVDITGELGQVRTADLRLRRPSLYPLSYKPSHTVEKYNTKRMPVK